MTSLPFTFNLQTGHPDFILNKILKLARYYRQQLNFSH